MATDFSPVTHLEFDRILQNHENLMQQPDEKNPRSWIRQLVGLSDEAHDLLCQMEPQLSYRYLPEHVPTSPKDNRFLVDRCNILLQSWASTVTAAASHGGLSVVPGLPQRAQYLLERMEASMHTHPTVESYQAVLTAWTYSVEHLKGTRAEHVFRRMPEPTPDAYRLVIRAWTSSRERRAAFVATGHLMKMLRKLEYDSDMEPQLEDYNVILQAWTTAEDKMAPRKANSLLKLWESAVAQNLTEVQPDLASFQSIIVTASRRPLLEEMGTLVDEILGKMNGRYIVGNQDTYGAAICAWKNCAVNVESNMEQREWAATRCYELLEEMTAADQRVTSYSIQVLTAHVNYVMEALVASDRIEDVVKILNRMEENLSSTNAGPLPNAATYALAVQSLCRSTEDNQLSNANQLVNKYVENVTKYGPSRVLGDGTRVFDAFIQVCATTMSEDAGERSKVFAEALAAVEFMKSRELGKANSAIYSSLLRACGKLIRVPAEQNYLLERVFRLCCADGMVDDVVLRSLKRLAPGDLYTKLVVDESETVEGIRLVPEFWTVNALSGRVVTADGRKTTPLSVDGRLTVTKAMQEYRMRTIRQHRKRALLQGGRLTQKERQRRAST